MEDHKVIREALDNYSPYHGESREMNEADYLLNNCVKWLRQLLDENERLQKENEQNLDIMNRMSNEMDGIEEPFKYEIEQLQADKAAAVRALEDVSDYQHRWSDSPATEIQKIARTILQRIGKR